MLAKWRAISSVDWPLAVPLSMKCVAPTSSMAAASASASLTKTPIARYGTLPATSPDRKRGDARRTADSSHGATRGSVAGALQNRSGSAITAAQSA